MLGYKEKLKAWNSTDKYKRELDFLYSLIAPEMNDMILDFGCGIMTAINKFNLMGHGEFYGYDIEEYGEQSEYHLYDKAISRKYDCIYFMHSLAHIKDPVNCLVGLRSNLTEHGKIVIVTPNLNWLDTGYNSDPTVVKHYGINGLNDLIKKAGYNVTLCGQFGNVRGMVNERLFIICKKKL